MTELREEMLLGVGVQGVGGVDPKERKASVCSLRHKSAAISQRAGRRWRRRRAGRSFSEQAAGAGTCLAVAGQPYLGLTTCRKSIDD